MLTDAKIYQSADSKPWLGDTAWHPKSSGVTIKRGKKYILKPCTLCQSRPVWDKSRNGTRSAPEEFKPHSVFSILNLGLNSKRDPSMSLVFVGEIDSRVWDRPVNSRKYGTKLCIFLSHSVSHSSWCLPIYFKMKLRDGRNFSFGFSKTAYESYPDQQDIMSFA
jgi:hypothetical protein